MKNFLVAFYNDDMSNKPIYYMDSNHGFHAKAVKGSKGICLMTRREAVQLLKALKEKYKPSVYGQCLHFYLQVE